MTNIVLFATGSPLLVDVEESLFRAGIGVAAGVRNRPGVCWLPDGVRGVGPEGLTEALRALPFLVPLFTPAHRQTAAREAAALGLTTPFCLIDPSVAAPRHLELGPGCYINAGCALGSRGRYGAFVLINRGANIGHHADLGDFVLIGPGVTIAGNVTVGKGTAIGAGATLLPGVTIGENATIGAGAVVVRDLPDGCLALGPAARIVRTGKAGDRDMAIE